MKKLTGPELFEGIGYIREDFILEASAPEALRLRAARRRRVALLRTAAIAACVCLAVVGVLRILPMSGGDTTPGDSPSVTTPRTVMDAGFEIEDGVSLSYSGMGVEVYVPASVKTVSKSTFVSYADAPKVKALTLTSSETKLEEGALAPLTALQSVTVSDGSGSGVDIADFLDMTVTDIVNKGCSLSFSHVAPHGGGPVYTVGGYEGIELLYAVTVTTGDDMESPLCEDAKPCWMSITDEASRDVTVAPGVHIGMDVSETIALGCEFIEVFETHDESDSGDVFLKYLYDGYDISLALTDLPKELYQALFPRPEEGFDLLSEEEIKERDKARAEFARAPVGEICKIRVNKHREFEEPEYEDLSGTGEARLDMDLTKLLNKTVAGIKWDGITLSYSHTRHGGYPVYTLLPFDYLELEFCMDDLTDPNDVCSPLREDAKPRAVHITHKAAEYLNPYAVVASAEPGIVVGRNVAEAVRRRCEFYEVYRDEESGMIGLKYNYGEETMSVLLEDVPQDVYDSLFTEDHLSYNEEGCANFLRSPVGTIYSIEMTRRASE